MNTQIEFRCDKCNTFVAFDASVIQAHYAEKHQSEAPKQALDRLTRLQTDKVTRNIASKFVKQTSAQEIESDPDFAFVSQETIAYARQLASVFGARLYKFKTLADGIAHKTLVLSSGELIDFDIFIDTADRKAAARTMSKQDINLNHYLFMPSLNFVVIADDVNGSLTGLMLIEDPLINELYDNGLVNGVSVEYIAEFKACSCAQNSKCSCNHSGVRYCGIAVITVPFNPADDASQMQEMLSTQIVSDNTERILAQVQSGLKQRVVTNYASIDNASQVNSYVGQSDHADNTKTIPSVDLVKPASTASVENANCNSVEQEAQTSLTKSDNMTTETPKTMSNEDITKLVTESINAAVTKLSKEITEAQTNAINTAVANAVEGAISGLKADLITMSGKVEKFTSTTNGTGSQQNDFTKEELQKLLPARVEMSDFGSFVSEIEAISGKSLTTKQK